MSNLLDKEIDIGSKEINSSEFIQKIISNLSHEIRTPLNGMLGFINLLSSGNFDNERKAEYLEYLNFSGVEITKVFDNLIDLSTLESGFYKTSLSFITLSQLFEDLMHKIHQSYPLQKINITYTVEKQCKRKIISDPKLIREAFKHLIDNAIKYSQNKTVKVGCYLSDEKVVFFVKDNGIGIPPLINKYLLYKKFYQLHMGPSRSYSGLGIGLTITKKLVEMLNGNIWYCSKENNGSTFYFSIPLINV